MSQATRMLTWAVPVDYDQLIPALQAYRATRLKVSLVSLASKLPPELLEKIRDYTMDEMLNKELETWEMLKACHEGSCLVMQRNHFDDIDWEDLVNDTVNEYDAFRDEFDSAFQELMSFLLLRYETPEAQEDMHDDNVNNYRKHASIIKSKLGSFRLSIPASRPEPSILELLEDFGLQVFLVEQLVTTQMLKYLPDLSASCKPNWYQDYTDCDFRAKTFVVFLTLPCKSQLESIEKDESILLDTDGDTTIDNSMAFFNIIKPEMLNLTDDQKRKFSRALKVLRLKPHFNPAQITSILPKFVNHVDKAGGGAAPLDDDQISEIMVKKAVKDVEESEWPKLMNLTSIVNSFTITE